MKIVERHPAPNEKPIQAFATAEGAKFVTERNKVKHEATQCAGGWKVTRTKANSGESVGHVDFFANLDELQNAVGAFAHLPTLLKYGVFNKALGK